MIFSKGCNGFTMETDILELYNKLQQLVHSFGENAEGHYEGFHMQDAPMI